MISSLKEHTILPGCWHGNCQGYTLGKLRCRGALSLRGGDALSGGFLPEKQSGAEMVDRRGIMNDSTELRKSIGFSEKQVICNPRT